MEYALGLRFKRPTVQSGDQSLPFSNWMQVVSVSLGAANALADEDVGGGEGSGWRKG